MKLLHDGSSGAQPADAPALQLRVMRAAAGAGSGAGVEPVLHDAPRPHAVDALDDFDLRDLASPPQHASATAWAIAESRSDPFGVLDIAGAQAQPSGATLSELVGETPSPRARFVGPPVPASGGLQSGPAAKAVPAERQPSASTAVLDELHDEFVRVVRDPSQLAGRSDWGGAVAPEAASSTAVHALGQAAELSPLLLDILQPPGSIDQVIQQFDPLSRSTLLDVDGPEDVLRLFAPELAHDMRVAVPSLTRREHHELSPDSHVRMGGERPGRNAAVPGEAA